MVILPLKKIKGSILGISKGDLSQTLEISTKDELWELAYSLNQFEPSLKTMLGRLK